MFGEHRNSLRGKSFLPLLAVISLVALCLLPAANAQAERGRKNAYRQQNRLDNWNAEMARDRMPPQNLNNKLAIRRSKANEVIQYLDTEVNPCDDFFGFACGKWAEHHAPENENDVRTPQKDAELRVIKELGDILNEQDTMRQEGEEILKVKDFYRSCLRARPATRDYLKDFIWRYIGIQVLSDGNFRSSNYNQNANFNWMNVLGSIRARLDLNILINLEIKLNADRGSGNSVYLSEPKNTIIPPDLCNEAITQEVDLKDEAYETIQSEVAGNMQKWFSLSESEANHFAGDVVSFEFNLCRKMRIESGSKDEESAQEEKNEVDSSESQRTNNRRRYKRYNRRLHQSHQRGQGRLHGRSRTGDYLRMVPVELSRHFRNIINFSTYMSNLNKNFQEQVYLKDEAYFENLAKTMKHPSARITMSNYIIYQALLAINFPNDESEHRQRICVQAVQRYFPKVIGERYNSQYGAAASASVDEVKQMFEAIKGVFKNNFEVEWLMTMRKIMESELDQWSLRAPIYENLDLRGLNVGRYQDYWKKMEIVMEFSAKQYLERLSNADPAERLDSIEVYDFDAKMLTQFKEVAFGWPLLRPPFYHEFYPKAIQFSFLGQRLARELAQAFDDESWRPTQTSVRPWDSYILQVFQNNSECYRSQYSSYLSNNPDDYRNSTKLREIVADSTALNVAFQAYLDWLEQQDTTGPVREETLRDVNYSNTQLFFINFAQTRCMARANAEEPPEFLPLDWHTEERYYVNGPLANNEEFAREFGCAIGSEMSVADKCSAFAEVEQQSENKEV